MASLLAALRVKMFMPHPSETEMVGKPGWQPMGDEQREQLENVANTFLDGLRIGLEAVPPQDTGERLERINYQYRGFAYEGCAMGLAVADSLSLRPRRVEEFIAGPGAVHLYMAYIGVGWGMARTRCTAGSRSTDLASTKRSSTPNAG